MIFVTSGVTLGKILKDPGDEFHCWVSVKMDAVLRTSKEIRDRLQIPESGRCSPAGLSRATLLGSTESLRKSLQMEMDSIRVEQLEESVGRTLSSYISLKVRKNILI